MDPKQSAKLPRSPAPSTMAGSPVQNIPGHGPADRAAGQHVPLDLSAYAPGQPGGQRAQTPFPDTGNPFALCDRGYPGVQTVPSAAVIGRPNFPPAQRKP